MHLLTAFPQTLYLVGRARCPSPRIGPQCTPKTNSWLRRWESKHVTVSAVWLSSAAAAGLVCSRHCRRHVPRHRHFPDTSLADKNTHVSRLHSDACVQCDRGRTEGQWFLSFVFYIALLHDEHMLIIAEVADDWPELMIPQRIMQPSIARTTEQLDPRYSMQTYHHPNQLH